MGKLFVFFLIISVYDAFLTASPLFEVTINEKGDMILQPKIQHQWHHVMYMFVSFPMTIYGIMMVARLRAAIRSKYGIPTGKLGRLEDCCYVSCCNCCVMTQMARQTADYDDEPAAWCTTTGMKRPLQIQTDTDDDADDDDNYTIIPAIAL